MLNTFNVSVGRLSPSLQSLYTDIHRYVTVVITIYTGTSEGDLRRYKTTTESGERRFFFLIFLEMITKNWWVSKELQYLVLAFLGVPVYGKDPVRPDILSG